MGSYTTSNKVARYLNLPSFSSTTTPTDETVEDIIARIEGDIDNDTNTAWRERQVYQEMRNIETNYVYGSGIPIGVMFRPIQSFSTAKGDKLELWDGSSWIDWTATKTEGRANDYWIEPPGTIWIVNEWASFRRARIRVTYRYGKFQTTTTSASIDSSGAVSTLSVASTAGFEVQGRIMIDSEEFSYTGKTSTTFTGVARSKAGTSTAAHSSGATVTQVNKEIESLATKMAVIELLRMNFRTNLIPVSGSLSIQDVISGLERETESIISRNTNIQVL